MRFINGEQLDRQAGQRRQHRLGHQPFRGHVEKALLACRGAVPGRDIVGAALRRVDAVRRDPGEPERGDLVLHQGDQRRYHHREPLHDQRGDLETQRLARSRRHHRERVAPGKQGFYRRFLAGAETLEPEDIPQNPVRGGRRFSRHAHQCRTEPMSRSRTSKSRKRSNSTLLRQAWGMPVPAPVASSSPRYSSSPNQ